MVCYEFKGGMGTASRVVTSKGGEGAAPQSYTVGAIVQSNFGLRPQLMIAGVPVGKEIPEGAIRSKEGGSIIIAVATDAPLLPHQLKRLARRAAMGVARTGSTSGNGSGDLFIAFSTAPGAVAADGSGRNSPFAAALLRHMAEPGQSINDLMIAVRRDVIAQTRGTQRPWEQGSLIERFDFVVSAGSPAPPKPAADSPVQLSALARSVGDAASIESFLRDTYLSPDPSDIARSVRRTYAEEAIIFGSKLDAVAIGKMKGDWFAQWRSWSLELEPGSLSVSQLAKHRAAVDFTMRYVYDPKDGSVASQSGRAQVSLGLVLLNGEWRVSSESSAAIRP
jgi:uncharacterized caspase-like protein